MRAPLFVSTTLNGPRGARRWSCLRGLASSARLSAITAQRSSKSGSVESHSRSSFFVEAAASEERMRESLSGAGGHDGERDGGDPDALVHGCSFNIARGLMPEVRGLLCWV